MMILNRLFFVFTTILWFGGKIYKFDTLTEASKSLKIHMLTLKNKNKKYSWKKNTISS